MTGKILIAYYSHSGNTEKIARIISQKTNGTLYKIEPETPYPRDYNTVVEQAKKEIKAGFKPQIINGIDNIGEYETLFIGSPNWWSTIAPPIAAFLGNNDLSGKIIIPFYTHGGGGGGNIERDIAKLCPKSKVLPGLSVYGTSGTDTQITAWLKNIN